MHGKLKIMKPQIGDKVLLIDYTQHTDWSRHSGEEATISKTDRFSSIGYSFNLVWRDGSESAAPEENLKLVKRIIEEEVIYSEE